MGNYGVEKRDSRRVQFSAHAEFVVQREKFIHGEKMSLPHLSGFVVNSSTSGAKFKITSDKIYSLKTDDIGVLYIDPELSNDRIFTFLVKISWIKDKEVGIKFIGGDIQDVSDFKKILNITDELLQEESNNK